MIGSEPSVTPSTIPKKSEARFGASSFLVELPKAFAILSTASASPTTVSRSPICRRRSGVASSSIPARRTREIVMLNASRTFRSAIRLPLILGLVTTIWWLTRWIFFSFSSHTTSVLGPKRRSVFSFLRSPTNRTLSPTCKIVSASGICSEPLPSMSRVTMTFTCVSNLRSRTRMPSTCGFVKVMSICSIFCSSPRSD